MNVHLRNQEEWSARRKSAIVGERVGHHSVAHRQSFANTLHANEVQQT